MRSVFGIMTILAIKLSSDSPYEQAIAANTIVRMGLMMAQAMGKVESHYFSDEVRDHFNSI